MFTLNSCRSNPRQLDLGPVVQKRKQLRKHAFRKLPFKTMIPDPFNTTVTTINTSNSVDTMFTVNSCWSNQDQLDLAPVVQKRKWIHKDAFHKLHPTTLNNFTISLLSTTWCDKTITWTTLPTTLLMIDKHTCTHTQNTHKTHTETHTHTQTHTLLQQYWWQSLKTAITSAERCAVFDDSILRQASLQ